MLTSRRKSWSISDLLGSQKIPLVYLWPLNSILTDENVCWGLPTPREEMSYRRTGEDEGGKYKRVEEAHLSAFGGGAAVCCVGTSQARSSCRVTIGRVISFAILSQCKILPRLWGEDHGAIQ